jgi:hypothetical protein
MLLCSIGAHLCRRLSDRSAYFSAIAGRSRGKPVLAPGKVRSNGRLGSRAVPDRVSDAVEHLHFIGGLHVGEDTVHNRQSGLMSRPIDFRRGIAHHDHSVDPLRTVVDTHSGN